MQTIEIKFHRKILIIYLVVIILAMIGFTYYIFTADKYAGDIFIKILYVVMNAYFAFSFYKLGKRLSKNGAVITMSGETITINDDSSEQSYKWRDIQETSISKDDNGYYLSLRTFYEEKKVAINWLDKSPEQIKNLIDEYRNNMDASPDFTI